MKIVARSTQHYNIIKWHDGDTSNLKLLTKFYDKEFTLRFHSAFSFNKNLSLRVLCNFCYKAGVKQAGIPNSLFSVSQSERLNE